MHLVRGTRIVTPLMRAVGVLGLLLAPPLVGRARGQVDPSGQWRTLHTAHFRVHFRPAYREVAAQVAREAERAYGLLASELHPPLGIVDVTLGDNIDAANGSTSVFPSNRIVIFPAPPATDPGLQNYDSWLRLVTVHELAHVFHLDRARGLWRVLRRVFGRAPVLFPNQYQPSWAIEGLATYYESRFTGGGRVKGSFHTQLLGADRAGNASRSPWDALFFTRWPDGLVPYAYGGRFFDHLAGVAGDSAVPRFIEATAKQLIPYRVGRQVRRAAPGRTLEDVWPRDSQPPPAPPLPGPGAVLARGLWSQPVPRVSPDGRRVALVYDDGKSARRIRIASADDFRVLREHRVNGVVSYDWLGDTLVLAQLDFTSRWQIRSDLYRWLPNGAWQRLTRGARLTAPRGGGSGRGSLVAAVALTPGGNHPAFSSANQPWDWTATGGGGASERWDKSATWGEVVPSPDGSWIAATRHADGHWALVRWPAGSPDSVTVLFAARGLGGGQVVTDPTWTLAPDTALLFVAERSGFPQVFRWSDSSGAIALTAERLGARTPAALPDGTLLYSALAASGWELRRAPPVTSALDSAGFGATAARFDSAPPVPTRETGYAAGPSLRPHFWIPLFLDAGASGRFVGAATLGTDAVGQYVYVAQGLVAWDAPRAAGAFALVSRALANPTLDLSASSDWAHTGTTPGGTVVSERDQEAALGASFVARRWRTVASIRLAAEFEGTHFVAEPDTPLAAICRGCASRDLIGGSVSLGVSHFVGAPLAISPEDGFAGAVTYRRREEQGTARSSNEIRARFGLYAHVPGPRGFAHHVLAVRLAAGERTGPLGGNFSVGGVSQATLDLGFGQTLGGTRTFPVRGYRVGEVRGRRAATASLEYRVPLALVGRSLGHLPVGADKLSIGVFGDIGNAWDRGTPARLTRLRSVGVELIGDITFNYDVPLRVRLGLADPLAAPPSGRARTFEVYAALAADF